MSQSAALSRRKRFWARKEPEVPAEEGPALSTVYCAENPMIDIVVVHGLNGDAFKSFTTDKNHKFWLKDEDMLPRDLPDCRVLTFSYHASVTAILGKTSSDTILQHATTLVQELAAHLRLQLENTMERPIISIYHSPDGIIVKRARSSHLCRKHIYSIFISTYGIMFFGTPQNGSNKANLATFVRRMVDTLPDALKKGSEILQDITDNFQPKMKRFHIFSMGAGKDKFISNTRLYDTDYSRLRTDHRNMCKFASSTSPGYRLVVSTLLRYSEEAPNTILRRWAEAKETLRPMRKNAAKELYQE
ncbi:ribonuclease-like protein p/mrp subunit [Xylogone sp. PMI_703]|nr:ribonuclease-like protein p/mrp subunit [Xylogone sp. PMI_703]